MKIGKFDISLVETGNFALDGGAMFGVVPKVLWSKAYHPGDELNRITLTARLLLVRWDDRIMLVDTGNGTKLPEKLVKIYNVETGKTDLDIALQPHGITTADVTDVVLTHLHFDHAGGATKKTGNNVIPSLPNAKYFIQKDQLNWAENPTDKDRASYFPENFIPLKSNGMFELTDGDGELFPGINIFSVHGHTRAMQLVKISGNDEHIFYAADLCPTSAHVHAPFVMGYDNEPLKGLEEKKKFFGRAYEENWTVVYEHDAFTKATKIISTEKGFRAGDIVDFD